MGNFGLDARLGRAQLLWGGWKILVGPFYRGNRANAIGVGYSVHIELHLAQALKRAPTPRLASANVADAAKA